MRDWNLSRSRDWGKSRSPFFDWDCSSNSSIVFSILH